MFTNSPGDGVVQPKLKFIVSSMDIISMDIKGKLEIPEAESHQILVSLQDSTKS